MKKNINRLTNIEIKGYKSISFQHPISIPVGDITIMLGANGAGKSNIVSFFKMLGYMMSGRLQMYIAQAGTNQSFLYYGAKQTPTLSASLKFESDSSYDIYRFSLTNAAMNRLILSTEELEWKKAGSDKPYTKQLVSDYNESAMANSDPKDMVSKIVGHFLSNCKVYQFSDSSQTSPMRQASTVESAHYLQSEANNLASFLFYLKNNYVSSYRRIVEYAQSVVPQFKDFYLEPERGYISLKWTDVTANDYVFSADQFSDGSIRFIALATLLLQPEDTMPSVIIIDEPELGLHPYAIDQLAEMVKDASLHSQIILATQSPNLIDNFEVGDICIVERDEDLQSTVVKKLDEKEYEAWLHDYTMSELWEKNVFGGCPV